jgi:hypothetical protein
MPQPQWKLISSTDTTALFIDETGKYLPELAIVEMTDESSDLDIEATAAVVYRFPLEQCYKSEFGLICVEPEIARGNPLADYTPWFARSLDSVADCVGRPVQDLIDALCSNDPCVLAGAYDDLIAYHGLDNFDSDPQEWTMSEVAEWPERGEKLSMSERDEFTNGYLLCALWCGVVTYKHDEDCPCRGPSEDGDAYDPDECTCDPVLVSSDDNHSADELTADVHETLQADAEEFYSANVTDIRASGLSMGRAGFDFWLNRNGLGQGFWDEKSQGSMEADDALDRLDDAARAYGEMTLTLCADMKIHVV